jgi:hypothetical protein
VFEADDKAAERDDKQGKASPVEIALELGPRHARVVGQAEREPEEDESDNAGREVAETASWDVST